MGYAGKANDAKKKYNCSHGKLIYGIDEATSHIP
jgi:hypothetical protein